MSVHSLTDHRIVFEAQSSFNLIPIGEPDRPFQYVLLAAIAGDSLLHLPSARLVKLTEPNGANYNSTGFFSFPSIVAESGLLFIFLPKEYRLDILCSISGRRLRSVRVPDLERPGLSIVCHHMVVLQEKFVCITTSVPQRSSEKITCIRFE